MRYKPFVLITTPIGIVWGVYEGFKLAGSIALVIIAQVSVLSAAFFFVIRAVRKERAAKTSEAGSEEGGISSRK